MPGTVACQGQWHARDSGMPGTKGRQSAGLHTRACSAPAAAHPHLQAQRMRDLGCAHGPAAHAEATADGSNTLAAQLGQRIHRALANAHEVGGDPGSQALQAGRAAGRGGRRCAGVAGGGGGVAGSWGG